MTYSLIERRTGNVVADFDRESDAFEFVRREMGSQDDWGLFEFGAAPSDNRLIAAGAELRAAASPAPVFSVGLFHKGQSGISFVNRAVSAYHVEVGAWADPTPSSWTAIGRFEKRGVVVVFVKTATFVGAPMDDLETPGPGEMGFVVVDGVHGYKALVRTDLAIDSNHRTVALPTHRLKQAMA